MAPLEDLKYEEGRNNADLQMSAERSPLLNKERPLPKISHNSRSHAACIHCFPVIFAKSSIHLLEGLPTLRLPNIYYLISG